MKKLLPFKIRPFNMANFSGGSGELLYYFLFNISGAFLINTVSIFIYSLSLFISSKKNKMVEVNRIEDFLNKVYKRVGIVLTVLIAIAFMCVLAFEFYYFSEFDFVILLAYIYMAICPFLINYLAILSAMKFAHKKKITVIDDETWVERINVLAFFGLTVAFSLAYLILAFLIFLPVLWIEIIDITDLIPFCY